MATIFEMARALGEELQKTPQVEALVAAKAAYESDPEIAKLVEEYTKLHYDFEAKMNAGGISIEEQRAFNEQMKAKGEAIRTGRRLRSQLLLLLRRRLPLIQIEIKEEKPE